MEIRACLLFAVAAAGCAEKAVEMRLELPDEAFDVSCVNQVSVTVWSADFETDVQCVEVTASDSLQDLQRRISDRFALDMPADLIAVQVHARATTTPEECPSGDMIFYAAADYDGGERIALPVHGMVDCAVHAASAPRTTRVIDLRALVSTDPTATAPACAAPALADPLLESGTMHASNLAPPDFSPTVSTTWELASVVDGRLTIPVWNSTLGNTCPTVVAYSAQLFPDSAACVQTSGPTICAGPDELEVPIFGFAAALPSWDPELYDRHKGATLVAVWDAAARKPLSGATVTVIEGAGTVIYGDWNTAEQRFVPNTAKLTGSRGLAMVYASEPVRVAIAAAGKRTQERVIAAAWDVGAGVIAALDAR